MPKGNPNPKYPNKPRWQELLLDADAVKSASKARRVNVILPFSSEQVVFLNNAAKKRGISKSAYVRRATLVRISRDLGVSWDTLMKTESRARPHGDVACDPQHFLEDWDDWAV